MSNLKNNNWAEVPIYQRMRNILMAYRCLWRGEENKPYEWPDLVSDISYFMELESGIKIDFPANSLENFVRGLPHKDKKKRELGLRRYSIPRPERVEAMVEFLTNPGSKGYACDKDALIASSRPIVPLQFLEYLNKKQNVLRAIEMNNLEGRYTCQVQGEGEKLKTTLDILETPDTRMAMVELVKYVTKTGAVKKESDKDNKLVPESYSGWIILTPEENLLLCVQNIRDHDNLFYLSMGIDNAVYRSPPPQLIVFLEHIYPEDTIGVNSADDEAELISNIISAWSEKLCAFRKLENND